MVLLAFAVLLVVAPVAAAPSFFACARGGDGLFVLLLPLGLGGGRGGDGAFLLVVVVVAGAADLLVVAAALVAAPVCSALVACRCCA